MKTSRTYSSLYTPNSNIDSVLSSSYNPFTRCVFPCPTLQAEAIYESFVGSCRELLGDSHVGTGAFGEMMRHDSVWAASRRMFRMVSGWSVQFFWGPIHPNTIWGPTSIVTALLGFQQHVYRYNYIYITPLASSYARVCSSHHFLFGHMFRPMFDDRRLHAEATGALQRRPRNRGTRDPTQRGARNSTPKDSAKKETVLPGRSTGRRRSPAVF